MKKRNIIIIITFSIIAVLLITLGMIISIFNTRTANNETVRIYLNRATPAALEDSLINNGIIDLKLGRIITKHAISIFDDSTYTGSYVVEPKSKLSKLLLRIHRGNQNPVKITIGTHRLPQNLNKYLSSKLMDTINISLDSFYLFRPNTYDFYWTISQKNLMKRMHKEYNTFWSKRDTTKCGLSQKKVIILASIVDEETNYEPEMPMIASVYLNRLKKGMALQADPTVKYAVGDFTIRRITGVHLKHESPFNTYLNTGLPPEPICLPSAKAVDAVLNAAESNYLYFCASDKLDGTHLFAQTIQEHQKNARLYHRAISLRGIK